MIETTRNTRITDIFEVSLAVDDRPDDLGGERLKKGDIVSVRYPGAVTGKKVLRRFLYLLMEIEVDFAGLLTMPYTEPKYEDVRSEEVNYIYYEKRRYFVPFKRLFKVCPWLDAAKIENMEYVYEPFSGYEADTYLDSGVNRKPLRYEGLIFDKQLGRFL